MNEENIDSLNYKTVKEEDIEKIIEILEKSSQPSHLHEKCIMFLLAYVGVGLF
jgi:hypothetical protein